MPLRRRLTAMSAAIVGLTLVLASLICYLAMRDQLRGQVDGQLRDQATRIVNAAARQDFHLSPSVPEPPPRAGGSADYLQAITPGGRRLRFDPQAAPLPLSGHDRAVAAGQVGESVADRHVNGVHLRVLTAPLPGIGAIQLGRPLTGVDRTLSRLRLVLVLACLLGTGLAAALSRLSSRTVLRPVADLTGAAEHIQHTGDLSRRVPVEAGDEVGRMAHEFNAMLDALARSQAAQRQLVADASHELRTPVASLRMNVDLLRAGGALDEHEAQAMLADIGEQAEELTALLGDLIALARDGEPPAAAEELRLDELVEHAVVRARRHAPHVRFATDLQPTVVAGVADRLGRAVNNLLDNAAKHSPPGGAVDVRLRDGELAVCDHGAGIDAADLPHVFDRFYRGASARGRPGSGLGLAIVRQVAEDHAGRVTAEPAPGGGALFRMRLPTLAADPAAPAYTP